MLFRALCSRLDRNSTNTSKTKKILKKFMKTIEQFMDWLKRQKFWKAFLLAWGFLLVWTITIGLFLNAIGAEYSQNVGQPGHLFCN